ncbi:MAG: helicase HerA-like domain-containing protein, partial [Anaerococcus hydrogenalis]|nr:helicase HerA-like domain-containing protein [Anaerococcus hydrogenalis]
EVGNPEKPKCVFFFDEAHLLFSNAPKHMVEKITQIVRLIRSKGVGIFFITQNPIDIPSEILNQLGNRILHQMRAFSPREMQAVKEMAMTFRPNPKFEVKDEVMNLKTGEALVSTLLDDGSPSPVEKTLIVPPHSSFKTLSEEDLKYIKENSPYYKIYKDLIDRQSAYEILEKKAIQSEKEEQIKKEKESLEKEKTSQKKESSKQHRQKKSYVDKSIDSILGTLTRTIGREIARSIMGSLKKR